MMRDHGSAGARRNHDVLSVAKRVQETAGHGGRLFRVPAVERRLPAAGLILREIDLVAQTLEHVGSGDSDLRKDLIDDTGDKECDAGHDLPLCRIGWEKSPPNCARPGRL